MNKKQKRLIAAEKRAKFEADEKKRNAENLERVRQNRERRAAEVAKEADDRQRRTNTARLAALIHSSSSA